MPVTSASQFEAITSRVLIRIDKVLYQRGEVPRLKEARRELESIRDVARDPERLQGRREDLAEAAEAVRLEIPRDDELRNFLWDLMDYIDYQI